MDFVGKFRDFLFNKQNKFGQGVIWNIGSLLLLAVGGILLNTIILKFSNAENLGVFNQVFSIYLLISQIGVGGIQFSVLKEISQNHQDLNECSLITSSGMIMAAVTSSTIVLLSYLLIKPIGILLDSPLVAESLRYALPGLIFFSINKVLINSVNGLRHMRAYAVFKALRYVLILGIVSMYIILDFPGTYYSYALLWSELALGLVMLIYIHFKMYRLNFSTHIYKWFKPHISFGMKGFMSGILTTLMIQIDVLVLGIFANDSTVGIYSFAATMANGFMQIPIAIRWNVDPVIGHYLAGNEIAKVDELSRKVKSFFVPFMNLVGILSIMFFPIMMIILKPETSITTSWIVFSIIMIGVIIGSRYRPFIGVFLQGGRPGFHTILVGSLALINTILGFVSVPLLGIFGAAITSSLVNLLTGLSIKIFARKIFSIEL